MAGFSPQMLDTGRALDHLLALLAIEGLSGQEAKVAAEIHRRLGAAGCRAAWLRFDGAERRIGSGYQVGNLILKIPGKGVGRAAPRRLFAAHMDTVPLCRGAVPQIVGDRIVPRGNTGLGGDNRTAVGALITAVETLLKHDLAHPPLTFLFTVGEEVGLRGSDAVRLGDLGDPAIGFNVDGGAPEYAVIGAIAADRWQVHVHGRSSHAGVHPAAGISATLIASRAITDVSAQGYFGAIEVNGGRGTSNVGVISGGEATNQVTDYVHVIGESRSHSNAFLKRITASYRRAFERAAKSVRNNRGETGRVEFIAEREFEAFRLARNAEPVKIAKAAIVALGRKPRLAIVDGGLDANKLIQKGVPTVTLGAGQHIPHTVDEYVNIEEYLEGCRLMTLLACG